MLSKLISPIAIAALGAATAFAAAPNLYLQHNLVSNVAGAADVTDPNLVDPWGVSFSATGPFWVSNRLSGTATIYNGAGAITPTVVTISPAPNSAAGTLGTPTGQVQNPTTAFVLANGKPASFIFCTEDGLITAWNGGTTDNIMVNNSGTTGAVYKGLAIDTSATAPTLYAANFRTGKIDVFSGSFQPMTAAGGFTDPNLPSGYAPFNVWPLNGKLYVTYAVQDSNKFLDVAGAGNGVVDTFDFNGNLLSRVTSNGVLNSPWGVAIAPPSFGAFGGDLLVGNFGDGRINAFDSTGKSLGPLQDQNGNPISISGLWALVVGNGGKGGDINTLYFTAGVPDGVSTKRGFLGSVAPPAQINAIYNAAGGQTTAVAPGEIVIITGQSLGPSPLVSAVLPATGTVAAALSGTTVKFNGTPAPVIYSSASYTSVIVPYEIAGSTTASVVLTTASQTTPAFSVPVAATVPGVFTTNGGGTGQALALNQDGTLNSASNAAARGAVVIFFATGEGVTNPPGTDGLIDTGLVFREPVAPISVSIGGSAAQTLYAVEAPGDVAGVLEIGAVVPTGLTPGAVNATVTAGTTASQTVTLNVK